MVVVGPVAAVAVVPAAVVVVVLVVEGFVAAGRGWCGLGGSGDEPQQASEKECDRELLEHDAPPVAKEAHVNPQVAGPATS
jgi:hypothetical protein